MPLTFSSSWDVDDFFKAATGQDFISWFRAKHAGKGEWGENEGFHAGSIAASAAAREGFRSVCDSLPTVWDQPASLEEFLCLASVIINETASFTPVSEGIGREPHPGLSYAFDDFPEIRKVSYNKAPNKLAGDLMRDPVFIQAHGHRAMGNQLAGTTNEVWNGKRYPLGQVSTSKDPAVTGFLQECDFYKFRGRGLIQTTWRSNYLTIIDFIKNSDHPNPVIQEFRQKWAGLDSNTAATMSSNDDWDRIFQQTENVIAMKAVRMHSDGSDKYFNVKSDTGTLLGTAAGSAFNVGFRVSGSSKYGGVFSRRVNQLRSSLNLNVAVPPQVMMPHDVEAMFFRKKRIGSSAVDGTHTMRAMSDFRLPAWAKRVRIGVYLSVGPGHLRFFNADGTEAEPVGLSGVPGFGAVDVTLAPNGTVLFRAENGEVTTDLIRSLGYWSRE
jgi:hypothetical protein